MAAVPSTGRATEVERGAAPEADAARALYERYAGQIFGFCLHRLGSREEAEDAVQTTFLNAFRGLRRGIVPEAEAAWLFKIAENVCLTRHRSAWRRGRVESPSDMQALQDVTPAREHDGDELIPLGDALAAMPEAQRRAILLREWQGLSYKEIADEMDVSQSAVETLIFRARRSLANALETPWQERRTAGQVGRRAFDLGSLLAGLKTLFAGGAAAKVAVVAVAATGTAALAVADARHPEPPARVEPSVAAARAPDSARPRPVVATPVSPEVRERAAAPTAAAAPERTTAGKDASSSSGRKAAKSSTGRGGTVERASRSEASSAAATAPGRAEEPGAPAKPKPRGRATKAKVTTKPKSRPKPAARPRPQPKSKPKAAPPKAAPAPAPVEKPAPKPEEPKAQQPQPAPPPPPPAAASPPSDKEKDNEKPAGE